MDKQAPVRGAGKLPMPKVFISSTYRDLEGEREHLIDHLTRSYTVLSMELFTASSTNPVQECKEKVTESDVVVLIIGRRYGQRPESGVKTPPVGSSSLKRLHLVAA